MLKYILTMMMITAFGIMTYLHEYQNIMMIFFVLSTVYFVQVVLKYESNTFRDQLTEAAINGVAGVVITDSQWRIQKVNLEFSRLTGRVESDVRGRSVFDFSLAIDPERLIEIRSVIKSRGYWRGEIDGVSKQGGDYTVLVRVQVLRNIAGKKVNYVATFHDITKRKQLENKLIELSEKDSMTGLLNRRKFDEELQLTSQLVNRYADMQTSLVLIDIDHFKSINDQYGHEEGDRVIKSVAAYLKDSCRTTDRIYRVGGEEFAVMMPYTEAESARKTIERLKEQFKSLNQSFAVTFSAGISEVGRQAVQSYREADVALYQAKGDGRDRVCCFESNVIPVFEKLYAV
ncbi:sensor domain-containing diguanylate cyclase [Vibrio maerlii]|uniref:sensor domain-containing diguanylate cyclase n=1 Tax=Vibrio maerlii TaxID=2231648 RepID=UPI0013DECC75|nr:GGDEF domain-containing protein [Vibrio maerlii]